ncbi:hypothetical protein RclHR1_00770015 [Rhizophagus clarus]|uniref:Ubiquitin-related domain-containing protein n=1 Tax=Rhizophagus clarus TaxID=94130 RepID=A0A2Z6SDQ3_9GLOM|nr:hypothetical protein RclHR1_00770015 [Rhizophagus clarus]GES85603.1 ubiquitin-related domain-containing protein [Rhizophagus clarus]
MSSLSSFNPNSNTNNAKLLASALTSLTGSPVITQTEYLQQTASNGSNVNYQNINPLALHNSYLVGGAVSTFPIPQQNSENLSYYSLSNNYCLVQGTQSFIYFPNSQINSHPNTSYFTLQPCYSPNCSMNNISLSIPIPNNLQQNPQQIQQQIPQISQNLTTITINIRTLNGQILPINNVPIIVKISAIKFHIESKTRIPSSQQILIYSGIQLKDNLTLLDYNILNNNSIIYLVGQILRDVINFIDSDFLDPMYDCDFTNINDNNKRFMRGSHEYRRPCGWNRIAVKVLNKYSDNDWLGKSAKKGTWRYESDPKEWPVSYHGTNRFNAKSIAETGFDVTKGKRFKFGYGIYSTPDINVAALFANKFIHNNEEYCLVFQNRVNPDTLVKIPTSIGEYWISPKSDDIRPYGICIKKLKPRN